MSDPGNVVTTRLVQKHWGAREEAQDLLGAVQLLSSFVTNFQSSVREKLSQLSERLLRLEKVVSSLEKRSEDWLPQHVADAARVTEPRRFAALSKALESEWFMKLESSGANAGHTLKWVAIVNMYVNTKAEFDPEDIARIARTALDIILSCGQDVVTQVRWASCASRILRTYRRVISLDVPWRPLYTLLRQAHFEPRLAYQGAAILESQKEALTRLIRKARRFFPAGSSSEIWNAFRDNLRQLHLQKSFEALGWLQLLMPTYAASTGDGAWDEWVSEWIEAWGKISHNSYWDGSWMALLARLAKHDSARVVSWDRHLPALYTHFLWSFHVPVGTSSASNPIRRHAPQECEMLFGGECRPRSISAAKAIVYLLGTNTEAELLPVSMATEDAMAAQGLVSDARKSSSTDGAACRLERLVDLLEQYFHPSNGGRWTSALSSLLRHLMDYFMQRLQLDAAINSVMPNARKSRSALSVPQQRHFVHSILRLAYRGQFSKDNGMMETSCSVLGKAAYIAPDLVLPVCLSRFEQALETVTAAHLLVATIHTLSLCVRPLLLGGVVRPSLAGMEDSRASGTNQDLLPGSTMYEAGREAITAAMMAVLPGIDANDPPKTLACFRFYCSVLSNTGSLSGPDDSELLSCPLPLYTEEWLDELLSRIFGILSNLESSQSCGDLHNSLDAAGSRDGDGSFLLLGSSMFRPMLELLFSRLSAQLKTAAIKKVGRFLLTTTLSSVAAEASVLCNAVSMADPQFAAFEILAKLIQGVSEDLIAETPTGTYVQHVSNAQRASLCWRLGLMSACLYRLGSHVLPYQRTLRQVVDAALQLAGSPQVQKAGAEVLSALVRSSVSYYPLDQYASPGNLLQPWALEAWFCKTEPVSTTPCWHLPSEAELSLASELAQHYLEVSMAAVHTMCRASSGTADEPKQPRSMQEREQMRQVLLRIEGVVSGLRTSMPDFTWAGDFAHETDSVPLTLMGAVGAALEMPHAREKLAEALVLVHQWVNDDDSDSLKALLRVANVVMNAGWDEHLNSVQSMGAWQTDASTLHEPGAVALRYETQSLGKLPAKKSRPRWLSTERSYLHGLWRGSQAAYRPWLSTTCCEATVSMIPDAYLKLLGILKECSTHPYKVVRGSATPILERSLKRFPCLVELTLPAMLGALAGVNLKADKVQGRRNILSQIYGELLAESKLRIESCGEAHGVPDAADQQLEAAALGACAVLRGRSFWRYNSRYPTAMAALMQALWLSSTHTSFRAQAAINDVFLILSLRFIRPPSLNPNATDGTYPAFPDDLVSLVEHLLSATDGGVASLHWRYILFANTFLLFLLPASEPKAAAQLAEHFLRAAVSDLLPMRQLSLTALSFQACALHVIGIGSQWSTEVTMETSNVLLELEFGQRFLSGLANNHVTLSAAEAEVSQRSSRSMAMSREEAVVKSISATLNRFREWPICQKRPASIKGGQFVLHHVRSLASLTTICPEVWCSVLRDPLRTCLQDQSNLTDKAAICASAQMIAALLASGAAFETQQGRSAWDDWLQDLVANSLATAPLELAEMWALAVRYAILGMAERADSDFLHLLLDLVSAPCPEDAPSGQIIKHLRYVAACLGELADVGWSNHCASLEFQISLLRELPILQLKSVASVRQEIARCMALLRICRSGQESQAEPVQGHAILSAEERKIGDFSIRDRSNVVIQQVHQMGTDAISDLANGVHAVLDGSPESSEPLGLGVFGAERSPLSSECQNYEESIARLGCSLQFVICSMRSGNLAFDADVMLGCLPHLLRLQELPDPSLQPLAMEAKTAVALLKYLPVPAHAVSGVVNALEEMKEAQPWPARGGLLVYLQYFWFRQVFVLGSGDLVHLQDTVTYMLADKKLEVQKLAATSLSGLLKGSPSDFAKRTRLRLLSEVAQTAQINYRRRDGGVQSIISRHASVLGLKAFVLSTPYDLPRWLPDVLMGLVSMSGEPVPIKTTVTEALAEFKRTHEEVGVIECRDHFNSEQWEAIQDVSSTGSYFV